jgi:hypothetical protein
MQRGDIVRHKLENDVYRILKVGENVAVCQCPPHHHKFSLGWTMWESYICHFENLEPYPEGKLIFDWIDGFDDELFPNRWKQLMKAVAAHEPGEQLKLL